MPIEHVSHVSDILDIIQSHKENGTIDINSNSLEDVYINIENQANNNELKSSEEQIMAAMDLMYDERKMTPSSPILTFLLMIKQHGQYLVGNKIHFIQYVFNLLYQSLGILVIKVLLKQKQ